MNSETPKEGAAGDPSMEEILSSIRRILSEDEKEASATPPEDDVLVLDQTMLVKDEAATPAEAPAAMAPQPEPEPEPEPEPLAPAPAVMAATAEDVPATLAPAMDVERDSPLLANDTAESAAASIVGLVRTLAADRLTPVHRGGPTIEDLVREEIRPLLKTWLDAHLPALVERLVQNEIERVVNRAVP